MKSRGRTPSPFEQTTTSTCALGARRKGKGHKEEEEAVVAKEKRKREGKRVCACIEVASVGPVGYAHINPRLPSRFTRYNYLPSRLPYLALVNSRQRMAEDPIDRPVTLYHRSVPFHCTPVVSLLSSQFLEPILGIRGGKGWGRHQGLSDNDRVSNKFRRWFISPFCLMECFMSVIENLRAY